MARREEGAGREGLGLAEEVDVGLLGESVMGGVSSSSFKGRPAKARGAESLLKRVSKVA